MNKLIILFFSSILLSGCASSTCTEKNVGKINGDRICWPVGFGHYAWEPKNDPVSVYDIFQQEQQRK